jgi:hypothetical protein
LVLASPSERTLQLWGFPPAPNAWKVRAVAAHLGVPLGQARALFFLVTTVQPAVAYGERRRQAVDEHQKKRAAYRKTAACTCGALKVAVAAAPQKVHACTCLDCQRRTGSAFSYTAFFAESSVSVDGAFRSWRRTADSGRWHDVCFCPVCGSTVFNRMKGLPGVIGIPVGCFADPTFEKPAKLYWTTRRHWWLVGPGDVEAIETQ